MKMTDWEKSKRERERHYCKCLVGILGLDDFSIRSHKPPRPDVSLTSGDTVIGVEVTEYHSPPRKGGRPRRLVEQEWEQLRRQLMREVEATPSLEGIHGTICFRELELPAKPARAAFVTEMISCAQEHATRAPTSVSDFSTFPRISVCVEEVRLKRIRCHMSWDWNHNTEWVGTDSATFVECVRRKTTKNYDDRDLRELWLLIVSGPHLSQAMGRNLHLVLPEITQVEEPLSHSVFAKAYVLQYTCDVAYEWPGWRKIGQENFRGRHAQ